MRAPSNEGPNHVFPHGQKSANIVRGLAGSGLAERQQFEAPRRFDPPRDCPRPLPRDECPKWRPAQRLQGQST
jgi:hypothetical protein